MLKLAIKSTFQNTTPKDARWPVYFIASWFSSGKFAAGSRIDTTFVSRSLTSCRIYEKWIFIISSRGYITYPDRWSGSQVSAGYRTSYCKLSFYLARVPNDMRLYWHDTQFRTKKISPPRHLGLSGPLLSSSSCGQSESACEFSFQKLDHFTT